MDEFSWRGDNPVKTRTSGGFTQLELKKDGVEIIKLPHLLIMFPQFYQNHLEKQLKPTEYLTLKILVYLLLQAQTSQYWIARFFLALSNSIWEPEA